MCKKNIDICIYLSVGRMFEYSAPDKVKTFFVPFGFTKARNQLLAETIITAQHFFPQKIVAFEL